MNFIDADYNYNNKFVYLISGESWSRSGAMDNRDISKWKTCGYKCCRIYSSNLHR